MKKIFVMILISAVSALLCGCSPGDIKSHLPGNKEQETSVTPSGKERVYMDELRGTLAGFDGSYVRVNTEEESILFDASGAELDIFASRGPVYFAHESGVDATLFCYGGGGERVTARLFDPAGKMVREWVDMGEWGFERIAPDAPAGLWRLELSRPSKRFIWEDSFLDLTGAPPVFFLSPEKFWRSTR